MLKSPLFWKVITLSGCMVLLLVPLSMLSSLVSERSLYRDSVEQQLSQSTSNGQRLVGPFIAIPYGETVKVWQDGKPVDQVEHKVRWLLPEQLKVSADQQVSTRSIGIYDGQIWRAKTQLQARFATESLKDLQQPNIAIGTPKVVMAVGDSRGISELSSLAVNEERYNFQPGSGITDLPQGVHLEIPAEILSQKNLNLSFSLTLLGTQYLDVVPLGRSSSFALNSNWPHPSFIGNFLPESREVSARGFNASWQSSWFANNIDSRFRSDDSSPKFANLPVFSSTVINPVDHYQLTERAVKYAVLLICLTFMAFFLFETLTSLRVHPMQYLLIGLSLVMFFLVLLALSEHIGFNYAWLTASLSCATLNGVYLRAVLQGRRAALAFALGLLLLDAVLWLLLQSEDSALLLGTGVLMVALAAVMLMTRKIDWYGISLSRASDKP